MKKLIYGTAFLAIVGIGIIGCEKEIDTSQQKSNSQNVKEKTILYRVENGMLVLNTVDDFDQLIELSTDDFNQTLKGLDYTSYVESLNTSDINTIESKFKITFTALTRLQIKFLHCTRIISVLILI
jgi:hypothetical protein